MKYFLLALSLRVIPRALLQKLAKRGVGGVPLPVSISLAGPFNRVGIAPAFGLFVLLGVAVALSRLGIADGIIAHPLLAVSATNRGSVVCRRASRAIAMVEWRSSEPSLFRDKAVALRAFAGCCANGTASRATHDVFSVANWLHVCRIDTGPVTAQMVEFGPFWYRANEQHVGRAMWAAETHTVHVNAAFAVAGWPLTALPNPTLGWAGSERRNPLGKSKAFHVSLCRDVTPGRKPGALLTQYQADV